MVPPDDTPAPATNRGSTWKRALAGLSLAVLACGAYWLGGRVPDPSELKSLGEITLSPEAWFGLLMVSTFLSEDLTCVAAGLLVSQGILPFSLAAGACFSGIFIGDGAIFLAGRIGGRAALRLSFFRRLVPRAAEARAERLFAQRGVSLILLTRFLPGSRLPTYFAAGMLRTRVWTFATVFAIAAALWVPAVVFIAMRAGGPLMAFAKTYSAWALPVFLVGAGGLWLALRGVLRLATWEGRRWTLGTLRRWTRWEFWPPQALYAPVALYGVWLALRFRSATAFTLANPGMPCGGLAGESKSGILRAVRAAAPEQTARFAEIEPGETALRERAVQTFQASLDRPWPVVLKPDVGERGSGVAILRTPAQRTAHLERRPERLIAQEYVEGPEYGVFYIRYPGEDAGRIFSVAEKRPAEVTGDGHRTLETLILADDRAVCMAPVFLRRFPEARDRVPEPGERVRLVEIGTHCQGAVFFDANELGERPDLRRAVDAIGRNVNGFYFGRFDIRAPSREAFARGEGLRVLELNGLTSEAAHIYHPGNSLIAAYRTLFAQWRAAFQIGDALRQRGHTPPPAREVLRFMARARKASRDVRRSVRAAPSPSAPAVPERGD